VTKKKHPGGGRSYISAAKPLIPLGALRLCNCAGCGKELSGRNILEYFEGVSKTRREFVLSFYPPVVATRMADPATGRDMPFCSRCLPGMPVPTAAARSALAHLKMLKTARAERRAHPPTEGVPCPNPEPPLSKR
jgi:hypothetical protein